MKIIGILLLVIVGCYGLIDKCPGSDLKKVFGDCLKEYGGDKALLADWIAHKDARDEKGKCFRTCTMRDCGWFDENGKLTEEVPLRAAYVLYGGDESKIPRILEAGKKCLNSIKYDEKDICNTGENWSRCILGTCKDCGLDLAAAIKS